LFSGRSVHIRHSECVLWAYLLIGMNVQNAFGKITNAFSRPLLVVAVCRVDDTAPASTQSHHKTVRDGSRFAARSGKEESIGQFARSLIFSLIACNYEFALDGVLTETTDHEFLASANSSAFQICQMNLSQVFLECASPCFLWTTSSECSWTGV